MTATNFANCFAETEKWEGWHRFSNAPGDPGGATWCGLTARAYDAWRRSKGLPTQFVRRATDDEIRQIFRDEYWASARCDDCFTGLDLVMFDIAINSGPRVAVRLLQRALEVPADGWFGLETLGALQEARSRTDLIEAISAERLSLWEGLRTWKLFGAGWRARGEDVRTRALAMAAT